MAMTDTSVAQHTLEHNTSQPPTDSPAPFSPAQMTDDEKRVLIGTRIGEIYNGMREFGMELESKQLVLEVNQLDADFQKQKATLDKANIASRRKQGVIGLAITAVGGLAAALLAGMGLNKTNLGKIGKGFASLGSAILGSAVTGYISAMFIRKGVEKTQSDYDMSVAELQAAQDRAMIDILEKYTQQANAFLTSPEGRQAMQQRHPELAAFMNQAGEQTPSLGAAVAEGQSSAPPLTLRDAPAVSQVSGAPEQGDVPLPVTQKATGHPVFEQQRAVGS